MQELYPVAVLGRGGNYSATVRVSPNSTSRTSGFSRAEAFERSEVVVDLTVIPWEQAVDLALGGPMLDATVPEGHIRPLFSSPVPWEPVGTDSERNWRFGNARGLDEAACDVYVTIAERFGAKVWRRGEPVPVVEEVA